MKQLFFIPLLLLMYGVKGQELRLIIPKYDSIRINIPLKEYNELREQNSVSIIALRHLNDSLQKKLYKLIEYFNYTCPVMQNLDVVGKQQQHIKFINRVELREAIKRFNKRYKIK